MSYAYQYETIGPLGSPILPVQMDRARVAELEAELPERPLDKQRRYQKDLELPFTITSVLCVNRELSEFFEEALATHNAPKQIANYITKVASGSDRDKEFDLNEFRQFWPAQSPLEAIFRAKNQL